MLPKMPGHLDNSMRILPGSRVTSLKDCYLRGYQPSPSVSPADRGAAGQQGDSDKATAHLEHLCTAEQSGGVPAVNPLMVTPHPPQAPNLPGHPDHLPPSMEEQRMRSYTTV